MLDKAAFMGALKLPRAVVEVPELGDSVTVRGLTGSEREQLFNLFADVEPGKIPRNYRATLCCFGMIDHETGKRLFPDEAADQVGQLPFAVLRVIAKEIERLSGLGEDVSGNSTAGSD